MIRYLVKLLTHQVPWRGDWIRVREHDGLSLIHEVAIVNGEIELRNGTGRYRIPREAPRWSEPANCWIYDKPETS